jgi:hypothetical protein
VVVDQTENPFGYIEKTLDPTEKVLAQAVASA